MWLAVGAEGCCAVSAVLGLYKQRVLATIPLLTLQSDCEFIREKTYPLTGQLVRARRGLIEGERPRDIKGGSRQLLRQDDTRSLAQILASR